MYFKLKPVYNMLLDNICLVFFTASKYTGDNNDSNNYPKVNER